MHANNKRWQLLNIYIIYLKVNKVCRIHYENTNEDYDLFEGFLSKQNHKK